MSVIEVVHPDADRWAVGYLLEFADGDVGRVVIRNCDNQRQAEATADVLERITLADVLGDVASQCGKPLAHVISFTCALSALDNDEPSGD